MTLRQKNRHLSFWDHVEDLRKVLITAGLIALLGIGLSFFFQDFLLQLLLKPLKIEGTSLYLFSPMEGFLTALKLSFWAGILLTSPIWLFLFIQFLLPGLRRKERKLVIPFFLLSIIFMGGGLLFAARITFPFLIFFFHQYNERLGENLWSFGKTVDLSLGLMLAHAALFELFALLLLFVHSGFIKAPLLVQARRGVIVGILILAAFATPPDVFSQLLLAAPLYLMYEGVIIYARYKALQTVNNDL